jgi:hypothetical protein
LTTLKIAVFAPIPRASVAMATIAKPGFLPQYSRAVAQVLPQCFEGSEGPHRTSAFLQVCRVPELPPRRVVSFGCRRPRLATFLRAHGQVKGDFVVQISIEPPAVKQTAQALPNFVPPR